jgi:hypothetical protein
MSSDVGVYGGQIEINYDPEVIDVIDFEWGPQMSGYWLKTWNSNKVGEEWITFVIYSDGVGPTGNVLIGNLTVQCKKCGVATPLDLDTRNNDDNDNHYSKLADNVGNEIPTTWNDGTVTCGTPTPPVPELPTLVLASLGLLGFLAISRRF